MSVSKSSSSSSASKSSSSTRSQSSKSTSASSKSGKTESSQSNESSSRSSTSTTEPRDSVSLSSAAQSELSNPKTESADDKMENDPSSPDPASPEYGAELIGKLEETSPELASKLDPDTRDFLSPDEVDELTDIVSHSPELGGLEGYTKSLTENDNGYLHGFESEESLEALGEALGRGAAPEARYADQVSESVLNDSGFKRDNDFYEGYLRGLDQQPEVREGMEHHTKIFDQALLVDSRNTVATRDGRVEQSIHTVVGFRGKHEEFVVNTFDPNFTGGVRAIEPGVTEMTGSVMVNRDQQLQGLVPLNGPELREAGLKALERYEATVASGMPDSAMKDMADKMLGLYGGMGGQEGAQRVSGIYTELGLPVPSYLQ